MEIILILLKDVFNGIIVEGSFRGGRKDGKMESVFYRKNEKRVTDHALTNFNKYRYIFANFNKYISETLSDVNIEFKCMTSKNHNLYTIHGNSKNDFDTWADIYIYMLHLKKLFSSEMEGGYVFEKEVLNGYRGEFDWLDIFVDENEFLELSKMKP